MDGAADGVRYFSPLPQLKIIGLERLDTFRKQTRSLARPKARAHHRCRRTRRLHKFPRPISYNLH